MIDREILIDKVETSDGHAFRCVLFTFDYLPNQDMPCRQVEDILESHGSSDYDIIRLARIAANWGEGEEYQISSAHNEVDFGRATRLDSKLVKIMKHLENN